MTFTLLAIDRSAGLLGIGTASYSLAVGNSVPAIDPAVGAVASQAWTNRALRHRVLDAVRSGASVEEAIAAIPDWDPEHAFRQVAVIDATGRIASHTGSACSDWAGERRGPDHIAIGNLLTDAVVVDALSAGFSHAAVTRHQTPALDGIAFARRILVGLLAADTAGGDRRGRQSAAVAVAAIDPGARLPADLVVDLRVDDSAAPLPELTRLLGLREAVERERDRQPSKGLTAPSTTVSSS